MQNLGTLCPRSYYPGQATDSHGGKKRGKLKHNHMLALGPGAQEVASTTRQAQGQAQAHDRALHPSALQGRKLPPLQGLVSTQATIDL
jgi:conjugal transfer/entry exclusion protein